VGKVRRFVRGPGGYLWNSDTAPKQNEPYAE
jgi:hypothetical protein